VWLLPAIDLVADLAHASSEVIEGCLVRCQPLAEHDEGRALLTQGQVVAIDCAASHEEQGHAEDSGRDGPSPGPEVHDAVAVQIKEQQLEPPRCDGGAPVRPADPGKELNNPPGIASVAHGQITDEAAQLRAFSRREPNHRPPPSSRAAVTPNQTEPWTATTA
jgi:hypothetical protein